VKCLECSKIILYKRTLNSLLTNKNYSVCQKCYITNAKITQKSVLPIEYFVIFWYNLDIESFHNIYSYDFLFKNLIIKFLKNKKRDLILMFDHFDLALYSLLDQLLLGNIWLLTTYNKGEYNYEV